jgi:hypothetical protein
MVIGKSFAWGHLPKAGGDATAAMFQIFDDLVDQLDPPDSDVKHTLFRDRLEQIENKRLILNFRRLPEWVLSRAHHVNKRGLAPDYEPQPMQSPHELSQSEFPDFRLGTFTDEGRLHIDRWLRVESLADDFLAFISELRDVSDAERARVLELGVVNEGHYDRQLEHWFTPEQIEEMYRRNPVWAAIEARLYGDLVTLR